MKYTLSQAIAVIEKHTGLQLSAIQFEDGSGQRFNYIPFGNKGWRFIDLEVVLNEPQKTDVGTRVCIIHDVLNGEYLQNDEQGEATIWADSIGQSSWYEPHVIEGILRNLKREGRERWIDVKKIIVNEL
jgi:hypothetical protein